jgi:hypothetical protein
MNRYAVRTAVSVLALTAAGNATALEWEVGDARIDLYGYARLNAAVDFDQDATTDFGTQAGSFDKTVSSEFDKANNRPLSDQEDGEFGVDAEQSRLGVTVRHKTGVRVTVEGDYRGGDFRLRQAYGEYQGLLAGRTWSNYNSFVGYTPSVDFDALAGLAGLQDRVAQVRYTTGNFSVALEKPIGTGRPQNFNVDTDEPPSEQDEFSAGDLPSLTARYEGSVNAFSYSVAGVLQQVEGDQGEALQVPGNTEDKMVGGAAFVAGSFQATDALTLNATFNVSEGANSYLYRSGDDFGAPDGFFDGDDMEPISGYGGSLGLSYTIGKGSLNAGVGAVTNDWDDVEDEYPTDATVQTQHETNTNALVNYMYRPVENVMFGAELQHLDVELVNGEDFDANRAMFAAEYSF